MDIPNNCQQLEIEIRQMIAVGSTRYKVESTHASINKKIRKYSDKCDKEYGGYLSIASDLAFGKSKIPSVLERLGMIIDGKVAAPRTIVAALNLYAKLTLHTIEPGKNFERREAALCISRENQLLAEELVTLTNWVLAAHYLEDNEVAQKRLEEAENVLNDIESSTLRSDPAVQEAAARLHSHKAKNILAALWSGEDNTVNSSLEEVNTLYLKAIETIKSEDHLRVNLCIEWAEELLELFEKTHINTLEKCGEILETARHGLDSHNCDLCRGYFYYVSAIFNRYRAQLQNSMNLQTSLIILRGAEKDIRTSAEYYEKLEHPNTKFSRELELKIMAEIEELERPRKIFLSHKSADKELVRRFKEILIDLRFEPWLDEDAMEAGVNLERSILKGLNNSCAVVFFVTPEFVDEQYLATEIDYSIAEKRKKGDYFSIITLLLPGTDGEKGKVPDLLKPYVYKEPSNELEALRELIRALPLNITIPNWKR